MGSSWALLNNIHSIAEANSLMCEDHTLVARLLILTCE